VTSPALLDQAREVVQQLTDPGVLLALVTRAQQAVGSASGRRVEAVTPLTERELTVLQLLPTRLSTREIGRSCMCRSIPSAAMSRPSTARDLHQKPWLPRSDQAREMVSPSMKARTGRRNAPLSHSPRTGQIARPAILAEDEPLGPDDEPGRL